jgi:hypothetical protein
VFEFECDQHRQYHAKDARKNLRSPGLAMCRPARASAPKKELPGGDTHDDGKSCREYPNDCLLESFIGREYLLCRSLSSYLQVNILVASTVQTRCDSSIRFTSALRIGEGERSPSFLRKSRRPGAVGFIHIRSENTLVAGIELAP